METDAKKLPEHSLCADATSALSNNLQQWNLQYNQ